MREAKRGPTWRDRLGGGGHRRGLGGAGSGEGRGGDADRPGDHADRGGRRAVPEPRPGPAPVSRPRGRRRLGAGAVARRQDAADPDQRLQPDVRVRRQADPGRLDGVRLRLRRVRRATGQAPGDPPAEQLPGSRLGAVRPTVLRLRRRRRRCAGVRRRQRRFCSDAHVLAWPQAGPGTPREARGRRACDQPRWRVVAGRQLPERLGEPDRPRERQDDRTGLTARRARPGA